MLREDPEFENEVVVNRYQRLFRHVTETMHFLSHAQHALSDAMINLNTPSPRELRARPFVIQSVVQSAVVQNVPVVIPFTRGNNQASTRDNQEGRASAAASQRTAATSTAASPAGATATTARSEETGAGEPMETSESSSGLSSDNDAPGGVDQRMVQQLDELMTRAFAGGGVIPPTSSTTGRTSAGGSSAAAPSGGSSQNSGGISGFDPRVTRENFDNVRVLGRGAPSGVDPRTAQQLNEMMDRAFAGAAGINPSTSTTSTAHGRESSHNSAAMGGDAPEVMPESIEVSVEPIVVGIEVGPEITIGPQGETPSNSEGQSRVGENTSANIEAPLSGGQGPGGLHNAGMLQNMLQAALSNMGMANVSVQAVATPNSSGSPASATAASASGSNSSSSAGHPRRGHDSRARGNTQTQPTTSTRTRSSAQIINVTPHGGPGSPMGPPIGLMMGSGPLGGPPNINFDLLLPCNSHHIPPFMNRSRRVRQATQQRARSVPPSRRPTDGSPTQDTPTAGMM